MQEIDQITEKKSNYWRKVNAVRTVLMEHHGMDYDEASKQAKDLVKNSETGRIKEDDAYMQNHLDSLNIKIEDPDEVFWKSMGIQDEEQIITMSKRLNKNES